MYKPIRFSAKKDNVPILSGHQIEKIGEYLISDFCPNLIMDPQAVDIELFVEKYLRMTYDFRYLSNDGRYLGAFVFNDTNKMIFYDPEKNEAYYGRASADTIYVDTRLSDNGNDHMYRFTFGHEAAHGILHWEAFSHDINQISFFESNNAGEPEPVITCKKANMSFSKIRPRNTDEWREWQANKLSAVLLMPAATVRKVALERGRDLSVKSEMSYAIDKISDIFNVSRETANIRLCELKLIGDDSLVK